MRIGIYATGSYLPPQTRTCDELLHKYFGAELGLLKNHLKKYYGIRHRHIADANALPGDLAIEAGRIALAQSPGPIDAVIFCGMVSNRPEPSTAREVAHELGLNPSVAKDTSDACHGFGAGIIDAAGLIATGMAKRVLITTGEMGSRIERGAIAALRHAPRPIDEKLVAYAASFTLGDAGGAIIIGPPEGANVTINTIKALGDSSGHTLCRISGMHSPIEVDQPVLTETVRRLIWPSFRDFMSGTCTEGETYYIVHQVSTRILRQMIGLIGARPEQFTDIVSDCGNTVSAGFPEQLTRLWPRLKKGDQIAALLTGSGVSASYCDMTVQISTTMDMELHGANNLTAGTGSTAGALAEDTPAPA